MLFYIKYGCRCCTEELIVNARDKQAAEEYARLEAEDIYYGYSCNSLDRYEYDDLTEEEFRDMEYSLMIEDIIYSAEKFNELNERHQTTYEEQGFLPFEL